MRNFEMKDVRALNIVAIRISLYGTTIMTELRLLAKDYGLIHSIKAMTEEERDIISARITSMIDYYDEISRNERKLRLRKLYEKIGEEEWRNEADIF